MVNKHVKSHKSRVLLFSRPFFEFRAALLVKHFGVLSEVISKNAKDEQKARG